ncbi:hypothetical protein BKE38_22030 [Pseudoroseomonas deserti]|uniref:Uncharacterized protein n=1 Tax=Teichococcus deserti TaxID=1817963 RepID=A0A1V2GX36_9PROT|nr:hypothetical protein [Pseudoroseomonas deserti]ONG48350.1 hypothetical protein BKE38_22030 [Pseudoroseomonas deserti]
MTPGRPDDLAQVPPIAGTARRDLARRDAVATPPGTLGAEAGAGYAAAARALSAVPPLGKPDVPIAEWTRGLDADAAGAADLAALLPGGPAGLAVPLALGLLRPDVRRWLGPERLAALAARLQLAEAEVVALLDAPPPLPASLGELQAWHARQLPMLGPAGGLVWLALFWRPDRGARVGPRPTARHALAAQLSLPATGRIDLRARLEEGRMDAVLETAQPLPRLTVLAMTEGFAAALHRLRLQGSLTVRHSAAERQT